MTKSKKILCVLLSLLMLFGSCLCFTGAGAATLGQQKNELESQLAALKQQEASLKKQYSSAQGDVNDQMRVVNLLYDQIDTYQQELETLSALMIEYTELAAAKEKEIDRLNEQMNKNFDLFKERLVFAQESGNMSYIDFILGSADLSDIISRTEVINDMLEYDRKILEGLIRDRDAIEKAKEEIELAMTNCSAKQTEYDAIVVDLKAKQAEAEEKLAKLKQDAAEKKAALERAQSTKKQTEDRLDRVLQDIANQSTGTFSGTFIWPLPVTNPGGISRGWIDGVHSGLDIHVGGWANNGKVPALSIASGKVVRTGYYSDWGNLVVVDHGGGYLSYYAHLHTISVSLGQQVSQGQQVGKIGSTGDSTGPHLHLVIYAPVGPGGQSIRTDPQRYVSYPR